VPKFELCKHNDELFSIYYRIFYELWTFADFDRLCKLEKRGDEIKKNSSPRKLLSQYQPNFADLNVIFYQNMPNLHNRYISAERKISQKNPGIYVKLLLAM
jgi:hypothetical protein